MATLQQAVGEQGHQAKMRRYERQKDQHGRVYGFQVEKTTGDPCSSVMLSPGGTLKVAPTEVPLKTPAQYLRYLSDPELVTSHRIQIDYERWIADTREAHLEYRKRRHEAARIHRISDTKLSEPPSEDMVLAIGPAPVALEPIVAASQGNPYVLGLTTKIDARLYEFFLPQTPQELEAIETDYSTLEELEEDADPDATGGKRQKVRGRAKAGVGADD